MQRRAFKYRLFTNANQNRELATALETHRRLFNFCLENRKTIYENESRSVSYVEQSAQYTIDCKTNPYYYRINRSSATATIRRLDKAFLNFFRRVKEGKCVAGYPKFKGKNRFNSIEFPIYNNGIKLTSHRLPGVRLTANRLYIQHIGTIRIKLHRPVHGAIKTVTLKREAGNWFAVLSCELPDANIVASDKPAVGIDVGLTHFLTTNNGVTESNPRYLKHALPELRRAGRSVSRKTKGGSNRKKAVRKLQKVHVRIKNSRREHHYAVACRLVLAFGFIAVERLNISWMLKNDRLARAISDAGWAGFLNILAHKAESSGVEFVAVNPKGTSQECSGCGEEVKKDLYVRWHLCPHCNLSIDRDQNAARNILARGLAARTGPVGANVG